MSIICATCRHQISGIKGDGFTVSGCDRNDKMCLTQRKENYAVREGLNQMYDYNLWQPKEEPKKEPDCADGCGLRDFSTELCETDCLPQQETAAKEKPLCFDCEDTLWCGDCPAGTEESACDPHCHDCEFEVECEMNDVLRRKQGVPGVMTATEKFAGEHGPVNYSAVPLEDLLPGKIQGPVKEIAAPYDIQTNSYLRPAPKVEPRKVLPDLDAELEKIKETIDHPEHYAEAQIPSGIECWDHYELAMTEAEFVGAMKNNIYKYIFRTGRKDPAAAVQDLEKARAYLKRWIAYLEGHRIVWMKAKKNDVPF